MNLTDIDHRSIGINYLAGGDASVRLWSPVASSVSVVIPAKNQKLPLIEEPFGFWSLETSQLQRGDAYLFLLDEKKMLPDPASLAQFGGVHGPSTVIDPKDFAWTDDEWRNIHLEQYIFYELHTGTFTPGGQFADIAQKLDYLKDLGITAIEIMPVAQFPGRYNWRYDGVFPFAVQESYGGAIGLQSLVNACHCKGLAVVLDVVYNHLGPEGNYFNEFGPYFTDKYKTPWGPAINFDDAWCDGVRNYFIENTLMWFRDFHIDALRLDAVHAIKDFGAIHIVTELRHYTDILMKATGRTHYLIAELDLNDTRYINPVSQGGYGLDAQWTDEFHHALRVAAGEPRTGYYEDFDGIRHLAKAYRDAYIYDGQYSFHRKKLFGVKAANNPGNQFIVFSQNHDHIGNRMLGERTSQLASFEMQKLLAGAVFVSPYLPLVFMGEEWGEKNPFYYFISHSDSELIEAVRLGRAGEFADFLTKYEPIDPASDKTFEQSRIQWFLLDMEPHKTMRRFYKTLIHLRKSQPALFTLDRKQLVAEENLPHQTITIRRWHQDQQIFCILNFSKQQQLVSLPPEFQLLWEKLFDSADPSWGGPTAASQFISARLSGNNTITIQPESFLIYSNNYV